MSVDCEVRVKPFRQLRAKISDGVFIAITPLDLHSERKDKASSCTEDLKQKPAD
jgi:hypothetical protein